MDPLFVPPRAIELITEAAPKHWRRRRGIRSGLLVQLRRCEHHPPLPSILLANVQSLNNKVDVLKAKISSQRVLYYCLCDVLRTQLAVCTKTIYPERAMFQ